MKHILLAVLLCGTTAHAQLSLEQIAVLWMKERVEENGRFDEMVGFRCKDAMLEAHIVSKLDEDLYDITLGRKKDGPHAILKTKFTDFTSKGRFFACMSKDYTIKPVKNVKGEWDKVIVLTEAKKF